MIPDYDLKGKTNTTAFLQHHWWEDRNVTSQLLNLKVAFYWRRMVDDKFIDKFREWNTPPYSATPDFIVMGIGVLLLRKNSLPHGCFHQILICFL